MGSLADMLLNYGAKVNLQDKEGRSALMRLCLSQPYDNEIFIHWLKHGDVSINLQDTKGRFALMLICQNKIDIHLLLLKSLGIELDLQDKEGWSALMMAAQSGGILKTRKLVECGASLNLRNSEGLTALMIACQKGYSEIAEGMLKYAETDLIDNSGKCALMHATKNGHLAVVKLLIKKGAHIDLQDGEDFTPLMVI